ncbi:MAG TPA: hypothetical protein VMO47_13075 [Rhodothermales bacterium]|nr:hypothetical protein [Rhodothermales bacterium]
MYERLLARCKTPNEVNRLHIALENRLTPVEIEDICRSESMLVLRANALAAWVRRRLVASKPTDGSHAWKLQMQHLAACSGGKISEPYSRRRIGQSMIFYSGSNESTTKRLIVCFTGGFQRMMVPAPSFLQNLPASRYDVLVLKDARRQGYAEGLPDVPGGFEGLVSAVRSIADRASYASVVSLGTSLGGLPALVVATRLGFDKGVSIGGIGRDRDKYAAATMAATLEEFQHSGANLLLVYGSDNQRDRKAARSFEGLASVRLLEVQGRAKEKIGHNPLHRLLLKRKLAMFLDRALDPSAPGYAGPTGEHASVLEI